MSELLTTTLIDHDWPLRSAAEILEQALDQGTFAGSIGNCHTPGVDSLVLEDNRLVNGGMARIFVARQGAHRLSSVINSATGDYTVGVHNHRFPVTIVPLVGRFINYEVEQDPDGTEELHRYSFQSAITGMMGVKHEGIVRVKPPVYNEKDPGQIIQMSAAELHTVIVPNIATKFGMTAWLVLEEPEEGLTNIYSPTDHLQVSTQGLYNPYDPAEAHVIVSKLLAAIQ